MYEPKKDLSEVSQKRLKAIKDFTELGSGFKIAQRDLSIRGAGDILGPEQAGFIDSIGLDMYIRLLNETVQEKLTGKKPESVAGSSFLNLDAYIPEKFATNEDKIILFQEILTAPSFETLARIKTKLRDNYGKLPKGVENLFIKRNIELLRSEASVEKLVDEDKQLTLVLNKDFLKIRGIGNILFEALIPYLSFIKVSYLNNVFKIVIKKRKTWQEDLENILKSLVKIKETNKILEVV
jgi:transcription-repair coupling factor (superfamily II helicase)